MGLGVCLAARVENGDVVGKKEGLVLALFFKLVILEKDIICSSGLVDRAAEKVGVDDVPELSRETEQGRVSIVKRSPRAVLVKREYSSLFVLQCVAHVATGYCRVRHAFFLRLICFIEHLCRGPESCDGDEYLCSRRIETKGLIHQADVTLQNALALLAQ